MKYNEISEHVRKLSSMQPDQLIDHLTSTHAGIGEISPGLEPHVHALAQRSLNYLNGALPKPAFEGMDDATYEPSKAQQHNFMSKYEIVNNPVSILDHIANGTLDQSHMEAIQTVHPEMYKHLAQEVASSMTPANLKGLSYAKKMALSQFLGMPLNSSLVPQAMAANQLSYATKGQPTQPAGKQSKSTLGGLKELKVAQLSETETSRSEADND